MTVSIAHNNSPRFVSKNSLSSSLSLNDKRFLIVMFDELESVIQSTPFGQQQYFLDKPQPINETKETKIIKLICTLYSYERYEKNWDGYEGVPAKNETVENTIYFINKLISYDIALPSWSELAGDGEIDLFWEKNKIFVDIGFLGNHAFSYFARNSEDKEFFGDNVPLNSDWFKAQSHLLDIMRSTKS